MFGRNWKKKEDYADILNYPSARQAWEFLRRNHKYQVDAQAASLIHHWFKKLPYEDKLEVHSLATKNNLTGIELLERIHKSEESQNEFPENVIRIIKTLKPHEICIISANCGEWLFPRHNLLKGYCEYPPMPEEDEPEELIKIFNPLSEGGNIICSPSMSPQVKAPEGHAIVLIDLRKPISPQIKGLGNKLKEIQDALNSDGQYKGWKLMVPPKDKVLKSNQAMKELPQYIRLLDACAENPGKEHLLLYEMLYPEEYKKFSKDGEGFLKNVEVKITKPLSIAKTYRDKDYNHIANKENKPKVKFQI